MKTYYENIGYKQVFCFWFIQLDRRVRIEFNPNSNKVQKKTLLKGILVRARKPTPVKFKTNHTL